MNKLKTITVLTMSMAALSTAFAAEQAVTESAQAAPVVQPQASNVELDRIVAVVNNDVITDRELQERTHVVAINLRRQNIQLPPMEQLRAQVLERLIFERAIKQRARETGIRIDDQMVNASIEQIARQNNLSVDQLRQRLMADGVSFSSFREEIRDEITTQRLREREVDAKIQIPESEIDAYLAEQGILAGVANHRILAGTNAPKILLLQRQVLHRGVVVLEHTVPLQRALSVKDTGLAVGVDHQHPPVIEHRRVALNKVGNLGADLLERRAKFAQQVGAFGDHFLLACGKVHHRIVHLVLGVAGQGAFLYQNRRIFVVGKQIYDLFCANLFHCVTSLRPLP